MPLEEQHGGKMDIILHKLTEDILCMSQLARTNEAAQTSAPTQQQQNDEIEHDNPGESLAEAAVQRVQRLMDFCDQHPECSLVDHPLSVQTVMSRAEIAVKLESCLRDCWTRSGCPVGAPAYAVLWNDVDHVKGDPCDSDDTRLGNYTLTSNDSTTWIQHVERQVANLSFPIIVKPLTAAGTKASHAMAILMDRTALIHLRKVPCLCQEYSNHDAVLYKVYVLGQHVSVHQRRSLPNLPLLSVTKSGNTGAPDGTLKRYVEFDSQRPYPRLVDFGYTDEDTPVSPDESDVVHPAKNGCTPPHSLGASATQSTRPSANEGSEQALSTLIPVTAVEVQPVVDALKRAFGLELFGFDILITSHSSQSGAERHILVVDVNYFPSYKEVDNFPALLAKYLTDRALSRRQRHVRGNAPRECQLEGVTDR
jgi:Inositol 1,3,4-trisphosphate 5/6-kinase ATP-grasp domain/Inositol 1,3,4-trisphosphate 5/6-kinase pre-ATP-grasp domain